MLCVRQFYDSQQDVPLFDIPGKIARTGTWEVEMLKLGVAVARKLTYSSK